MDGVMQAPRGPWEDPTKGFKFGGWVMPDFDPVFCEEIDRVFKETCDLLLAGFGAAPEPSANSFLPPPTRPAAPHGDTLTSSRVSSMGLVIAHYERAGGIKIGDTALDAPSDAERVRRERMKREG